VRAAWASVPRAGKLLALAAFLVGVCWSFVTPPFQVPDETTHFSYVQHLAEKGKPPNEANTAVYSEEEGKLLGALKFYIVVGRPGDRGVWSAIEQARVEAAQDSSSKRDNGSGVTNTTSQPPLYYAVGSVVYWASPSHDELTRVWLLRVLGALFAGITTLFVYLFLRELLPRNPLSWAAGAGAVGAGAAVRACSAAAAAFAAAASRALRAVSSSLGSTAPSSRGSGAGTEYAQVRRVSISWVRRSTWYSAYSNSGLQWRASNGHTSTQIPQYMQRAKSIANRSRRFRVRARPPSLGATCSLWESM